MTAAAASVPALATVSGRPLPSRVSLASEQFSGVIDFLFPHARREYSDLDTATLASYLDAFHATDTLADAWVNYLREHRGAGREKLDQALQSGTGSLTGPPPELTAFMRSVDEVPTAIDMARVEQGLAACAASAPSPSPGSGLLPASILARSCPAPHARWPPAPAPSSTPPAA